jgi:hypothetical protein
MFKFQGSSGRCSSGIATKGNQKTMKEFLWIAGVRLLSGVMLMARLCHEAGGILKAMCVSGVRGRKPRNGKPFYSSIGKGLWAFLVLGLGLLSVFLLVLFLGGFLVDLVKDIIERIKKK